MLVFVVISVGLVFAVSLLWGTWGLARMEFHHRLPKTHVFPGETIEYIQELANHKILPLPLLITETEVPSDCRLRKGKLSHHYKASRRLIVRLFSLRWYEKITRHYRFVCDHRGYYVFGPTRMAAGDIFGLFQTEKFFADPVAVTVFPRVLPVRFGQNLVLNPSGKAERQSFAFQDPFNITGTRNYQPGDSLRTIDWKATARLAKLQVREYNAAIDSHLAIILNVNTLENAWQGVRSDALELAVMAAASIGFASLAEGSEVMLLSNGRIQSIAMDTPLTTCVPYGRGPGHSSLLLESLARLTPYSVGTYDIEKVALNSLNRLKPESRVLFITAVMNDKIQDTIHHFARRGFDTSLIFVGNRMDFGQRWEGIQTFLLPGEEHWREMEELRLVRCY